jgi:predicted nuclease of predicted toxin-antitoxin system
MTSRKLKFLVDVGVSRKVEIYLVEHDYDVKSVSILNARMSDQEIIRLAVTENRIVITMDKDFGELVYHYSERHCGVLLLRLENATGVEKITVIAHILDHYAQYLPNHFCVFQRGKLRVRKKRAED